MKKAALHFIYSNILFVLVIALASCDPYELASNARADFSGSVVDGSGDPVSSARVGLAPRYFVENYPYFDGRDIGELTGTSTNSQGKFSFLSAVNQGISTVICRKSLEWTQFVYQLDHEEIKAQAHDIDLGVIELRKQTFLDLLITRSMNNIENYTFTVAYTSARCGRYYSQELESFEETCYERELITGRFRESVMDTTLFIRATRDSEVVVTFESPNQNPQTFTFTTTSTEENETIQL